MIAENEAEEYQQAEQKKQVYLTRVNQLFGDIKTWLKDEPLHVEQQHIEIKKIHWALYRAIIVNQHPNRAKPC